MTMTTVSETFFNESLILKGVKSQSLGLVFTLCFKRFVVTVSSRRLCFNYLLP